MKKIFIIIIFSFLYIPILFAADYVNVRVTEPILGVPCKKVDGTYNELTGGANRDSSGNEISILYDCQVKKGAVQIVDMLGNIIRYFTYIASLTGVLFIVYNGILYSMGGMEESMKEDAKKRISWTLLGLIILFLSGPFLKLLAPWIYGS